MKAKSGKTKAPASAKPARAAAKKPAPKAQAKPAPPPVRPARKPARPAPPEKPAPKPAAAAPHAVKSKRMARRKEFEHFRKLLLDRQRELMQDYNVSKGDTRAHPDSGTEDYIDYAVNSYAKEFLLSLTEMDRKQLLLVEEALRRIDRGEYGRCQQCGEEISRKRLEVAPWARHCVRCQQLEEKGLLPQYPAAMPVGEDLEGEESEAPSDETEVEPEETEDVDEESLVVEDEEGNEGEEAEEE